MYRGRFGLGILALTVMLSLSSSSARAGLLNVMLGLDPSGPACDGCTLSGPGTWVLYARIIGSDNYGLAAYSIPILDVTSVLHRSPRALLVEDPATGDSSAAGFTAFRTANNATVIPGGFLVGASQDVFTPTPFVIRGLGQMAGSFAASVPDGSTISGTIQPTWAANLVLAEGTYAAGQWPYVDFQNVNIRASAFGDPFGSRLIRIDVASIIIESLFIEVRGNGVSIHDGDDTPSLLDNTDFGAVTVGSVQQRTFTIEAVGFGPLTLQPPVITGPYSVVGEFPTLVNSSESFTLALDTNAGLGDHPGSISFANDSDNAPLFNFALYARIIPEPSAAALYGLALVGLAGVRRRG